MATDATPAHPRRELHLVPIGGRRRRGTAPVAHHLVHAALIGGSDLDLTQAPLPADGATVTSVALIGGVDVRVPAGTRVEVRSFGLGGRRIEVGAAGPDAPVLRVRALSVIGGVRVSS